MRMPRNRNLTFALVPRGETFMGGRQANQDNKQVDGRGEKPRGAPPENTGSKGMSKTKRR
jgi:hypothetical protein